MGRMVGNRTRLIAATLLAAASLPASAWGADGASAFSARPLFVGQSAAKAAGGTLSVRSPRAAAAGDVLLASVTVRAATTGAIGAPSGWRLVRSLARRNGRLVQAVYLRVAEAGEPQLHRWTIRNRHGGIGVILAYRGIDTARPVLRHGGRAGNSAASTLLPSLALPVAGARLVAFFAASGAGKTRPPAGMRERSDLARSGRWSLTEAVADAVKSTKGRTGLRYASFDRRRAVVLGQLIALRPAAASLPVMPGPGAPPGSVPSVLPPSTGTVYYVSTSGSDSNPGTLAAPWRTVQKALNTLQPGQRALVRAGTYPANLRLTRAGTSSAPITVEAYPGERPILAPDGSHPLEVASSGAYFRLRGFIVERAPGTSGGNIDVYGHHIELASNEIRFGRDQGIYTAEESDDVYVIGNWIHHNGEGIAHQSHGIYLQGTDHFVANNVIQDHPEGFGIQVYDLNHRSVIVSNTIVNSGHSGIVIGGSGGVSDVVVRNNVLAFNSYFGVQHDSTCPTSNVDVDHNVIWGNGSGPVQLGCGAIDTSGGNVLADPLFTDYAARNLRLQAGSPAIDQALPEWSLSADADGVPRPRGPAPDIGAYEY